MKSANSSATRRVGVNERLVEVEHHEKSRIGTGHEQLSRARERPSPPILWSEEACLFCGKAEQVFWPAVFQDRECEP